MVILASRISGGQRFGRWTSVAQRRPFVAGRNRVYWLCRCECGAEREIDPSALLSGRTTQCRNCGNREKAAMKVRLTHGQADSRLYNIWTLMKRRCQNEEHPDYHRYGGRGIAVCPEWQAFKPFHDWANANGYSDNLTIDRSNNDKGYEPDNCRWITRTDQNRNRRNNQRYAWRGQSLMISEIAEMEGISTAMLRQRVRRDGLSIADAVSKPIHRSSKTSKGEVN